MVLIKRISVALAILWAALVLYLIWQGHLGVDQALKVYDDYAKLILSSWPAAFIIIGTALLLTQHEAVAHFIKNRMTGIGPDGIKGEVISAASTAEVKAKNVQDAVEEKELESATSSVVKIESGIGTSPPNTIRKEAIDRFKKRMEIEDIMQTLLLERYGEVYRPHVKLSLDAGRSIVLDGLFTTYAGSLRAVEIKYLGTKTATLSLKFVLDSLLQKLAFFGIKKMTAIIIADNLSEEEAIGIDKKIKLPIKRYYFSYEQGNVKEVPIPPKKDRLF